MTPDDNRIQLLADGIGFPEGPRWHNDRLYLSDIFRRRIVTIDLDGNVEPLVDVPGRPAGLGFAPDGALIIASASDRRILRYDGGDLTEVASLAGHGAGHLNDMYVDPQGRAYVGSLGMDLWDGGPAPPEGSPPAGTLHMVTPEGHVHDVADELDFPNGITLTADPRVLVVAESHSHRLTAFDVAGDGTLSNRRLYAQLEEEVNPDGIWLDSEGGLWIASFSSYELLRLSADGEITDRIQRDNMTLACTLGGPEGRTLFVAETRFSSPDTIDAIEKAAAEGTEIMPDRNDGLIEFIEVAVPVAV